MKYQRAAQELETVLDDAGKLAGAPLVRVKAKAASLLWKHEPERARSIFLKLWDYIESQAADKTFDQREARTVLLRYLYPQDRKLAEQLLQKRAAATEADKTTKLAFEKIRGTDDASTQLARLAWQLLDVDATLAAGVLERSLNQNTAPPAILVLSRLRGSDPMLANYLAMVALEGFRRQPKTVAVVGMTYIAGYLYPLTPALAASLEVEQSDEVLRQQFMFLGYDLLKESLAESDELLTRTQNFSPQSLQFRTFSQAVLAATLGAMAQQYAPYLAQELNAVASQIIKGLPGPLAEGANLQAAVVKKAASDADDIKGNIVPAVAGGDFDKAQGLIDKLKDENDKQIYAGILLKAKFKALLTKSDLNGALKLARSADDPNVRMQMFTELARAARSKGEPAISAEVLGEARKTPAKSEMKGSHVRALFSITAETAYFSPTDALLMLQDAVKELNDLELQTADAKDKTSSPKPSILNDPNRFVDSAELSKAFAALSRDFFEETLMAAGRLDNKAVRAMARLSALEKILKATPAAAGSSPRAASPAPKND